MIPRSLGCTLLLALACREPPPIQAPPPPPASTATPASVMGAIVGANVTWGDALVRGDSAVLGSIYQEQSSLMTQTGDVIGRPAIVRVLLASRKPQGDSLHATATSTDQLDVAGDKAYEAGTLTYTMLSRSGKARDVKVRYVNFWQLDAGGWKLTRSLRPLP